MFRVCRLHVLLVLLVTLTCGASPASTLDLGPSGLHPIVRARIELSLQIASERLEEIGSCRALFEPYGRTGEDLLRAVRIVPAENTPYAGACGHQGVSLVTRVHGDTIGVCGNRLARLPVRETAARLLHEVLHHAGMGERPHDSDGLFPEQITRRVKRACRL